ncbi:MAG: 1,6-anhydro-N-acetylmuramyl-L-alanine amidase AmpD, partial [Burkholderiales bacterium]
MRLDREGVLQGVRYIPSPNCDERPAQCPIELLVIHNISLPPHEFGGPAVLQLFTNSLDPQAHPYFQSVCELKVSAHFLIRRDGEILQFVPCLKRAWHAGQSEWRGRPRCNDFSLGIELEGSDLLPFREAQYASLSALTLELKKSFKINYITGHSDIAPGRKTDPGPFFDWDHYRA